MANRAKAYFSVLIGVVVLALGVHYWTADRLGVLRAVYPAEAMVATFSVSCSNESPKWLNRLANRLIFNYKSLSNQIVYIAPQGSVSRCSSGWTQSMLMSDFVDDDTRFRYASQTKLFTASAVASIFDRYQLSLDTPLAEMLPQLPNPRDVRVKQITVRNLLNHTAGFDRMTTPDPLFKHYGQPWCHYNVEHLAEIELDYDPGTRSSYSNVGYCLLGKVLEQVTGQKYSDFMESYFDLKGRGMAFVTGPYLADEVRYDFRNSDFYGPTYFKFFDFDALSSSAGLSGNATELASFLKERTDMVDANLLSADIDPSCNTGELRNCFGLAFYKYLLEKDDVALFIQEGFLPGTTSLSVVDDRGGVLVVLTAGVPLNGYEKGQNLINFVYRNLNMHYAN